MKHPIASIPALILVLALAGCERGTPTLTDADIRAIRQIFDAAGQHVRAGDFAAWAGLFEEHGVDMPPNHPAVRGRAALHAWADSLPHIAAISFSHIDMQRSADLAVATSAYSVTFAPPRGPSTTDTGKQLVVFHRQRDGSWLISLASFNSDLPLSR